MHSAYRTSTEAHAFIAILMLCTLAVPLGHAQTYSVLYNFTGSSDGAYPFGTLVRDKAGHLYGTTYQGGVGSGVVYELTPSGNSWTQTVLHTFTGGPTDGSTPLAGMIQDQKGNLYGTTEFGGANNQGVVFKVNGRGKETVLYNFVGGKTDGCEPCGGLARDASGNLYGTTYMCGGGGAGSGWGTVFKLDEQGNETVLRRFTDAETDGAEPIFGSLLIDKAGILYGVTSRGGSVGRNFGPGLGTLYSITTSGGGFTLLHSFGSDSSIDSYPMGTPVMDSAGNVYGTAYGCPWGPEAECDPEAGGYGYGAVWEWTSSGQYKVLAPFAPPNPELFPVAGVMRLKGNVYGVSLGVGYDQQGGISNYGTIFELSQSLLLTPLFTFPGGGDGEYPFGSLISDENSNLYGIAQDGGAYGYGLVFKLSLLEAKP